jgi:hypothetical protein
MVGTSAIVCRRARHCAIMLRSAGSASTTRGRSFDPEKFPAIALPHKHTLHAFVARGVVND